MPRYPTSMRPMHTALALLLLLLLLGPAAAQMSDPVECVGNASTVEHDVREVCCADGSVCRFWGHGEPEACTSACHEYFVPLYTQCSYLWSQRNVTLGTEHVKKRRIGSTSAGGSPCAGHGRKYLVYTKWQSLVRYPARRYHN